MKIAVSSSLLLITCYSCVLAFNNNNNKFTTTTYRYPAIATTTTTTTATNTKGTHISLFAAKTNDNHNEKNDSSHFPTPVDTTSYYSRRTSIEKMVGFMSSSIIVSSIPETTLAAAEGTDEQSNLFAPKFVQEYEDFIETEEGLRYRDVTIGKGDTIAQLGDRVVFDWSGYTIGYFGRPFQAKGGPQGGAFDKDIDYFRTVIGSNQVIKGLECGLKDMKVGGVRQIIIPYGPMSYPSTDLDHTVVGPKPLTFSGQRALNFVLQNPRLDRTLLMNVKVIRIDKPNGSGGFIVNK